MNILEGKGVFRAAPDVTDIFRHSADEGFFNSAEWYELVAQSDFDHDTRVVFAFDQRAGIGLACYRCGHGRSLRSCTNMYTAEFNLLGNRTDAIAVREFARDLVSTIHPVEHLHLEGLDPAAPYFGALVDGVRAAGFYVRPHAGWITRFERTGGVDFDQYLSARPSILRNTWRRKVASLKSVTATFRTSFDSRQDPEEFLAAYENVQERSWKRTEPFPAFVSGLVRLAAQMGTLRLGVLEIDGVPAAAQFWIVCDGRATIYKLVHAEAYSAFSPGTLLTMHMIQRALEVDQPVEIDFGRGDEEYKRMWLSESRERWGIEAANPRSWRGLALCAWLGAGALLHRAAAANFLLRKAREGADLITLSGHAAPKLARTSVSVPWKSLPS